MAGPGVPNKGDRPDLLTAAIFIGLGALGLWQTSALDGGTLAMMGPGYLPRVVCGLLIAIGLVVGFNAMRREAVAIDPIKLRPVIVITLSIVVFAYAATHAGFVLASLFLIIAGSLADPGGKWRTTLLLAAGLTLFGALVFVYGLGVQVPLWPF
ncbi:MULTISPECIES: tripartite tricarboxylate transporter TctB family protein [Paracoccus]|uniref:tripartite tricarboxylate transporter TctB family protein n=1 Tax=Paracoccus TaxID=265 RepID=UPI0007837CD7|nr:MULTISPECIES: tripartite tricarboxylate transporter TctB family protein [Paracoccus]MCV2448300.1 tripartite tricarboxylate transporter TctB family protein [Paracoccus sp. DMF]MDQ7777763.1 tripartite tricarboxylate transporter TctB family protein [Paracoccus aminovorans]